MTTYQLRHVEQALARALDIESDEETHLSETLKQFGQLGFCHTNPGSGRRVSYTLEDVVRWGIACSLIKGAIQRRHAIKIASSDEAWDASALGMLLSICPTAISGTKMRAKSVTEAAALKMIAESRSSYIFNVSALRQRIESALSRSTLCAAA